MNHAPYKFLPSPLNPPPLRLGVVSPAHSNIIGGGRPLPVRPQNCGSSPADTAVGNISSHILEAQAMLGRLQSMKKLHVDVTPPMSPTPGPCVLSPSAVAVGLSWWVPLSVQTANHYWV